MCLVCRDIEKEKLSWSEAVRNLTEMVPSAKDADKVHYTVLRDNIDSTGRAWKNLGGSMNDIIPGDFKKFD